MSGIRRLVRGGLGAVVMAASAAAASPARPARIALSPYLGRLVTVSVRVGERDLRFLFDTGAGQTSLSPAAAEAAGCLPHGRQAGFRMSGELVEMPVCENADLSIAGRVWHHEAVGVLDIAKFLPKEAPPVDGTLSLQTFAGQAVTIDLAGREIVIETPKSLAARTSGMTGMPLRLATGVDGAELVPFAGVRSARGVLWLELDSGNLDDVLLAPHAASELGVSESTGAAESPRAPAPVSLPLPGGRYEGRASVRTLIHDGALNAEFFLSHLVTIDLARGRLWIAPRPPR